MRRSERVHDANVSAHLLIHEPRAAHAPFGNRAALVLKVVDVLLPVAVVGWLKDPFGVARVNQLA